MKKIYTLIITMFVSLAAFAQNYAGDVLVKVRNMEERNGILMLDLDIHIDRLAVNSRQSWTITPELVSEDGRILKEFPYILINGKTKRQLYDRKIKFGNEELLADQPMMVVNAHRNTDETIRYMIEVPYEPWMNDADLQVRQVLASCRDREQLFLITLENALDEGMPAYEVKPQVSFLMPPMMPREEMAVIHYRLDRTEIDPTYMDNSQELAKIDRMSQRAREASNRGDVRLNIEGFASPEGPYNHNVDLAHARAERLHQYVKTNFGLPENTFVMGSVAEDWQLFRKLVERSDVSNKPEIIAIIDSNDNYTQKEARIKALAGGAPYRQLLRDVLPYLRRAEYRISYGLGQYSDDDFASLMNKKPEELSHHELLLMAKEYPYNSDEFRRVFSQMTERYGQDTICNVNAAAFMLVRGENFSAEQYLAKAGNSPQALNNRGVYYLQEGDTHRAEEMFRRAASAGLPEARFNLSEMDKMRDGQFSYTDRNRGEMRTYERGTHEARPAHRGDRRQVRHDDRTDRREMRHDDRSDRRDHRNEVRSDRRTADGYRTAPATTRRTPSAAGYTNDVNPYSYDRLYDSKAGTMTKKERRELRREIRKGQKNMKRMQKSTRTIPGSVDYPYAF